MDEVGADHGGVAIVPEGHGAVAAHGLIGVEEAASGLFGDALLDDDDLGDGAHGGDLVSAALAAVHGAHDEDGGVGESGADAAYGADKLGPVLFFDVGGEATFVGAVVDDDEVGIAVLECGGEGLGVESAGHDGGGGAVEADAVVGEAAGVAAQDDAEDLDGGSGDAELDLFGAGGNGDGRGVVLFGVACGVDCAYGCAVGGDVEIAAAWLLQVLDFDGGGIVCGEADGAGGADGAGEDGSAEAVVGFAHGADGGVDLPAGGGDVDAVMAVPGPGLGDEDEAGAGVAEALLEELAGVAGDEVGGGGGVAEVDDSHGAAGLAGAEVAEGGVEVVEGAVAVEEELGLEGGVRGCLEAVGEGVGNGQGGGCWG